MKWIIKSHFYWLSGHPETLTGSVIPENSNRDRRENKQRLRFEFRKTNPLKYWKYSKNDEQVLDKWEDFTFYINKMLSTTSSTHTPWNIIDSNDKRDSQIKAMQCVLKEFLYNDKDLTEVENDLY